MTVRPTHRDGKSLGLPPNRELRDDGIIYDNVCGTFFLCGMAGGESFTSLADAQIQKYLAVFAVPEWFMQLNGHIIILLCEGRTLTTLKRAATGMRTLCLRLGGAIEITEEENSIFGEDGTKMENALRRVIGDGRFVSGSETCIPGGAVQEFNRIYGTAREGENWCCDL